MNTVLPYAKALVALITPGAVAIGSVASGKTTGSGIDWVLSRGVKVTDERKVSHGTSDHRPTLFQVRRSA